jgi:dethiobiotin synthetase
MRNRPIFVTGIGTGVGKTIVSAILVEKLKADYWKPIQAGDLDKSDTLTVKSLVSNPITYFYPEAYRLTQPYSPHKAAALDGIEIDPDKIIMPETGNQLIIEGAGGLMVPLNNNYLGSINHTLLSIDALKSRGINIRALLFNGNRDEYSQSVIKGYAQTKHIHTAQLNPINRATILTAANQIEL